MSAVTSQMATLADLGRLWALMRQTATQIPLKLDSDVDQEEVLSELMACCSSGLSPVVLDAQKNVAGALLVRRDTFEWGFRNSPALHVTYAALAPEGAPADLVSSLVSALQDKQVPLYFSVKSGNGLDLPALLQGLGFAHLATSDWGDLYLWEPKKPH